MIAGMSTVETSYLDVDALLHKRCEVQVVEYLVHHRRDDSRAALEEEQQQQQGKNEVLDNLDLTALVQERVDIEILVSTVDIPAIIDRLDLDEIVSKVDIDGIVRQVDIDAIVSKVDIDGIVRQVDINAIARQVDVDAIVPQVDIDAIARRIDIDAIVERIDIDAIVSRVDIDAIVGRLDLVALAEEVVNGIDLPEIIRESTGSMASDVVRDARMQSIDADVVIARVVDRIIRRRRARRTDAPGEPESHTRAPQPEPLTQQSLGP